MEISQGQSKGQCQTYFYVNCWVLRLFLYSKRCEKAKKSIQSPTSRFGTPFIYVCILVNMGFCSSEFLLPELFIFYILKLKIVLFVLFVILNKDNFLKKYIYIKVKKKGFGDQYTVSESETVFFLNIHYFNLFQIFFSFSFTLMFFTKRIKISYCYSKK